MPHFNEKEKCEVRAWRNYSDELPRALAREDIRPWWESSVVQLAVTAIISIGSVWVGWSLSNRSQRQESAIRARALEAEIKYRNEFIAAMIVSAKDGKNGLPVVTLGTAIAAMGNGSWSDSTTRSWSLPIVTSNAPLAELLDELSRCASGDAEREACSKARTKLLHAATKMSPGEGNANVAGVIRSALGNEPIHDPFKIAEHPAEESVDAGINHVMNWVNVEVAALSEALATIRAN